MNGRMCENWQDLFRAERVAQPTQKLTSHSTAFRVLRIFKFEMHSYRQPISLLISSHRQYKHTEIDTTSRMHTEKCVHKRLTPDRRKWAERDWREASRATEPERPTRPAPAAASRLASCNRPNRSRTACPRRTAPAARLLSPTPSRGSSGSRRHWRAPLKLLARQ